MADVSINFSEIITEIEEVKALLKSQGFTDDINGNEIFEKLERKTKEFRVKEVVSEIIAELQNKEPDLIVLEDPQQDPEVEILLDFGNDCNKTKDGVHGCGGLANEINGSFGRRRGVKRNVDFGPYPYPETSKHSGNDAVFDEMLDDSLPMDEVLVIEELVKTAEGSALPEKIVVLDPENVEIHDCETGRYKKSFAGIELFPAEGTSGIENVAALPVENAAPTEVEVKDDLLNRAFTEDAFQFVASTVATYSNASGIENVAALPVENAAPTEVEVKDDLLNRAFTEDALQFVASSNATYSNAPSVSESVPLSVTKCANTTDSLSAETHKQFEYLVAILPHVDHSYLKKIARQFSGDERRLNAFIAQVLECDLKLAEVSKLNEPQKMLNEEANNSRSLKSVNKEKVATDQSPGSEIQVDVVESSNSVKELQVIAGTSESVGKSPGELPDLPSNSQDLSINEEKVVDIELTENLYEEQFQYLVAVLPDADPEYLKSLVNDFQGNEEKLKDFIANALENGKSKPMYPTRGECQQKQEQEALVKRFTEEFSVEDFLQVFPDPVSHFESESRDIDMKLSEYHMAYLRSKFRDFYINDLFNTLKKKKFSLALAVQELATWKGPKRKSKRGLIDCKWPAKQNVTFLQELAYIENKDKIVEYLNKKKAEKQKAYDEARLKNELLTCGCCYDDELLVEDMATCREGHLFCIQCIKKGVEVLIGDGKSAFPCMSENCQSDFTLATLQGILAPSIFGKLVQRLQAEEINAAGIEGLETCPSCPYSTIPAPEDKIFKCLNPECMKETCRNCKEPSHIPLRCDEVEKNTEVKARTYIEDRMTEALVRTCWNCKRKFIKEGGCNKMSCACGALMCYVCRLPVKDYTHFNPYQDRESNLCPLYSNDGVLNYEAVKTEAEKAKDEIMNQNPEIRLIHDPTLKLPEVPSTSKPPGPPPLPDLLFREDNPREHFIAMVMNLQDLHRAGQLLNRNPGPHGIPRNERQQNENRRRIVEVPPVNVNQPNNNVIPLRHVIPLPRHVNQNRARRTAANHNNHHRNQNQQVHHEILIEPNPLFPPPPHIQGIRNDPIVNQVAELPNAHYVYPPPQPRNPAQPPR